MSGSAGTSSAADDGGFLWKTCRSMGAVTLFVALLLASYGLARAIPPLLGGAALGVALLVGMDRFVRRAFTVERARDRRGKNGKPGGAAGAALVAFALVKYPLVALAVWAAVHFWAEPQEIGAFVGGFVLLHVVITLRAIGRLLVDRMNASASAAGNVGGGGGAPRRGG